MEYLAAKNNLLDFTAADPDIL